MRPSSFSTRSGDTENSSGRLLGAIESRIQEHPIALFRTPDGKELAYVVHLPDRRVSWPMGFIYVHGIESHSGWFDAAARLLNSQGYPVFCIDRRGSGINRENRGCLSGHVARGIDLVEDLDAAIRAIRAAYRMGAAYLIGLSWGGKYAMAYNARHPGEVDGLVLITPGITPKVSLTFAEKLRVLVHMAFSPEQQHRIPIEPAMFTATPHHLEYIRSDPLRLRTVSAGFLWQSWRMDRSVKRSVALHRSPTLVLLAGRDEIIDNEATRRFFAVCGDQCMTVIEYVEQTHSIQLDAPERLTRDVVTWVNSFSNHRS